MHKHSQSTNVYARNIYETLKRNDKNTSKRSQLRAVIHLSEFRMAEIFKRFTCYRNLSSLKKGWRPVTTVTLSAFVTGIMRRLANYDGHLHAQNTL